MKFCPHCGNGNQYQMPYCTHCGHQLVMGKSLNYKLAKKNFDTYLDAHPKEKAQFDQKHFQNCPNCHRKCLLAMDFCAWCGAKLNHHDQYKNYKLLMTTSNVIPGFTYSIDKIVSYSINKSVGTSMADTIDKVTQGLKNCCVKAHGNSIIGFHLLIRNSSNLIAYGTAVTRKPVNR